MITKKDRRHNGWIFPDLTIKCKKKELIEQCLEPQPYYDNWLERRDGMRCFAQDKTKKLTKRSLRLNDEYYSERDKQYYNKIKKHELVRQLRKISLRNNC